MDDVQIQGCPATPNTPTPDCNYSNVLVNGYAYRAIPCTRDLQDFFRLWVCGINSNLLAALPTNSTITLNWGDVGSPNSANPTIDLFTAADPDGGIGYLTNETVATTQINAISCPYIGRLAPGGSIQLNASQFNGWAGNHFIMCGVSNGTGGLNLTIKDGNGNVLGQATSYLQIVDIKQMYERWSVGDNPNNAPTNTAYIVSDGLTAGEMPFRYSNPATAGTPYIMFVHGWNMQYWEKDRFAESAFKRLYWQGYQGRFGSFRWPTGFGFTGWQTIATNLTEKDNFDSSEYQAWQSAQGLLNKLNDLNGQYPGHVYLLAHSMGNVVANEALRLSGSSQVVNTYVASQAAVSAHTYDTNVANYSFYYPPWSLSADTPNIYGNWFSGNNGGGAGQVVSFYNVNDFALQRSVWQRDELLKPDQDVLEGTTTWYYGYSGSVSDPAPWNNFYKQTFNGSTVFYFNIVTSLNNRHEVMGYAAQSYTTALGATAGVHHLADSIDLTGVWPPDPTGNNYTEHFYHSAEFRGDNPQQRNYWSELLGSDAFNLK
jgi:pimeloyl-ACP methyl ester carboxylesterase